MTAFVGVPCLVGVHRPEVSAPPPQPQPHCEQSLFIRLALLNIISPPSSSDKGDSCLTFTLVLTLPLPLLLPLPLAMPLALS